MSTQDHEDYQIVWMHRGSDVAWLLMPQFKQRVAQFCADLDQGNAEPVLAAFMDDFGAARNEFFGVLIVGEGMKACGHMLCKIDTVLLEKCAFVHQWSKDVSFGIDIDRKISDAVDSWAKVNKAESVRISATSDKDTVAPANVRARLFRRFGFEPGPQICTRRLSYG